MYVEYNSTFCSTWSWKGSCTQDNASKGSQLAWHFLNVPDAEAAELQHLIQMGQKTSCCSTQSLKRWPRFDRFDRILVLKSSIAARGCGYWAERGAAKMQQLVAQQLQISRRQGCDVVWIGGIRFDLATVSSSGFKQPKSGSCWGTLAMCILTIFQPLKSQTFQLGFAFAKNWNHFDISVSFERWHCGLGRDIQPSLPELALRCGLFGMSIATGVRSWGFSSLSPSSLN